MVGCASPQTPQNLRPSGEPAMVEDFSDADSFATHFDDPGRDRWQRPEEVVELLDCTDGMTVVDLGAGTGYFLSDLSEAVGTHGRVLALDSEPAMVDFMMKRVEEEGLRNVRPDFIPPDDPSLSPRSVDRVLIVNTWHHIRDREEYARKLLTTLRPGGRILVVDFTDDSPIGPPANHRLTPQTVADELRGAGFDVTVTEESLPYQYAIIGAVP